MQSARFNAEFFGLQVSTIDMRHTIQGGGVLLVSTAQGTAGRDVLALVGRPSSTWWTP